MKRTIALLATALLMFSTAVYAEEYLPYDVKMSENGVFEYVPNGVITAYYGDGMVDFPAEVDGVKIKEIGAKVCFDLDIETVYLADGIEIINESAFEGSNLTDAIIPASVTFIGDRAFANCEKIASVTLNSDSITFGDDVFANTTYMLFVVPCTVNTEILREKIISAKGDDSFKFTEIHENLVESMEEKDIYGDSLFYCEDCGFKGSRNLEVLDNPFDDVPSESWYCPYVLIANNQAIMMGKSPSSFAPDDGITLAEVATIVARIREAQYHEHVSFDNTGENWYDVYVDYCYGNGIVDSSEKFDWNKKATRAEMSYFLSRCDLSDYYINEVPITDIPDVDYSVPYATEILDLYNKGIAVGSDERMTFYPNAQVKRSEAAALVTRLLYTNMRIELPKG